MASGSTGNTEEDREWLDYKAKFALSYDEANYASPLQAAVMHASHRLTERPFNAQAHFEKVLEVGAGTGQHFPFVRHGFGQYIMTDMDPAALEVAKKSLAGKADSRLTFAVQDAAKVGYADNSFDRVIAVHLLEHIYQPHLVLKDWRRVVRSGGTLSILIPTDPGMAWRLGRHLGPRRHGLEQGIAYDYAMAREHVNSCVNLLAFIRHYFPGRKESWWPFPVPSVDMNLFFACHATIEK